MYIWNQVLRTYLEPYSILQRPFWQETVSMPSKYLWQDPSFFENVRLKLVPSAVQGCSTVKGVERIKLVKKEKSWKKLPKGESLFCKVYLKNRCFQKGCAEKHNTGLHKLYTHIQNILKIINFTNCHTWLFFNKYIRKTSFPVSWVCEATLRN